MTTGKQLQTFWGEHIVFIFSPNIGRFDLEVGGAMLVRSIDTHLPMDV